MSDDKKRMPGTLSPDWIKSGAPDGVADKQGDEKAIDTATNQGQGMTTKQARRWKACLPPNHPLTTDIERRVNDHDADSFHSELQAGRELGRHPTRPTQDRSNPSPPCPKCMENDEYCGHNHCYTCRRRLDLCECKILTIPITKARADSKSSTPPKDHDELVEMWEKAMQERTTAAVSSPHKIRFDAIQRSIKSKDGATGSPKSEEVRRYVERGMRGGMARVGKWSQRELERAAEAVREAGVVKPGEYGVPV